MNLRSQNLSSYEDTPPYIVIDKCDNNLTDLGIFLSSLLLSISGLIAVLCSSLRKSNCTTIKCGKCLALERDNLDVD